VINRSLTYQDFFVLGVQPSKKGTRIEKKRVTYTYDALNRITSAIGANTSNYNLNSVTYDKMGNIMSLSRNGWQNTSTFTNKDNLVYTYQNGGNKLQKVLDNGNDNYGFKDGANIATEYTYDANANLITDANKGITSILYNHLNLPTEIKFDNNNNKKINYTYSADAVKLRKVVNDGGAITTLDYAGNYVYENNTLQFFNHPEGYVTPSGSSWRYIYQYKDHIDNIRLSYSDADGNGTIAQSEIIQENNYQPFGLKMRGFNSNVNSIGNSMAERYMFGGKEFDDSFNETLNTYDFGARNYDPALGRWMNLDPLAEQMRRHSPYNYAFDNPIYFQDPDGMMPFGSCCGGIFTRAASNPTVQKYANKAIASAKKIFKASVKVKPKLGIGISGKANIGPIKGEIDANVITASADAKFENNKLSTTIEAKVLTGSAKLQVGDKSVEASATVLKASIEATVDNELNVNVQDSSVEGPTTGDFTTKNGNGTAKLNSDNDFSIGASVKVAKAVEVGASVSLTSIGSTIVNGFKMVGSFVNALGTETVKESQKALEEGLKIP